jgi:hypothetical protein
LPYNEAKTSGGERYLKLSKFNIESLLFEIRAGISSLDVAEDFKHSLSADIELANLCFKEKNILSVLNCLGVLSSKLQTHVILSRCRYSVIEKSLLDIHHLQQLLIRLPLGICGPTGPTGPAGTPGPIGPPGATGPAGTTTIVTTSSAPIARLPIPQQAAAKSGYFDFTTHIITYCNSYRKR